MYNKSTSIKSYRLLVAVLWLLLVFQDSLSRHLPHWPCAQPFYPKGVTVESLDLHVMICVSYNLFIWLRNLQKKYQEQFDVAYCSLIFLNISILFKIPAPKALSPIGKLWTMCTPPLRPDQQWGPPKNPPFFTFGAPFLGRKKFCGQNVFLVVKSWQKFIVGNPFKTHKKRVSTAPFANSRCEIAQTLPIDPPVYVPDVLAFRKCWSFLCYVWLVQIISKILFVSRPKSNHTNALDSRV